MRRSLLVVLLSFAAVLGGASPALAGIWTPVGSGTSQDITALDYRGPGNIWLATAGGQIVRNGSVQASFPGATFTDLAARPSGDRAVATATNGQLYLFNGTSWNLVSLANASYEQTYPCSVLDGPFTRTWAPTGNLNAVAWASDNVAYVVGDDPGVVLKTTDGGSSWSDVSRQADGECRVDTSNPLTDVATVPGSDTVIAVDDNFGARFVSTNGFSGSAAKRGSSAVNCFDIPVKLAIDVTNPSRSWAVGGTARCGGSLSFGFSADGGTSYAWGNYAPDNGNDLTGLNGVSVAGGSALAAGNGGAILISLDGRTAYFQPADGALATTDWMAVSKADATNAAIGGRGGALITSTAATTIPDLIAPAGTVSGPAKVAAGAPAAFTANVADEAGGSGVNPASFSWSATGVPPATGNPATITFPSAGFYTLTVRFTDNAGNAGSASIGVTVTAGTVIAPGTKNPKSSASTAVSGGKVSLTGPKTCVGVGKSFKTTLAFKRAKRSRNGKVVRVTRTDFYVDGKRVKIDKKAPFAQRFSVAGLKPSSKHSLKARAYLKVRHGKSPKKSITVSFQVCSS